MSFRVPVTFAMLILAVSYLLAAVADGVHMHDPGDDEHECAYCAVYQVPDGDLDALPPPAFDVTPVLSNAQWTLETMGTVPVVLAQVCHARGPPPLLVS